MLLSTLQGEDSSPAMGVPPQRSTARTWLLLGLGAEVPLHPTFS